MEVIFASDVLEEVSESAKFYEEESLFPKSKSDKLR
jgi:hypothetical protein